MILEIQGSKVGTPRERVGRGSVKWGRANVATGTDWEGEPTLPRERFGGGGGGGPTLPRDNLGGGGGGGGGPTLPWERFGMPGADTVF